MSDEELPENEDAKEGDDAPDLPPPSTFAGKARKAEEEGGEEGEAPDAGSDPDAAEEEPGAVSDSDAAEADEPAADTVPDPKVDAGEAESTDEPVEGSEPEPKQSTTSVRMNRTPLVKQQTEPPVDDTIVVPPAKISGETIEADTLTLADVEAQREAAHAGLAKRAEKSSFSHEVTTGSHKVQPSAAAPPVAAAAADSDDEDGVGKPPKRRIGWRFMAAAFVIVSSMAAATAVSFLLFLSDIAEGLNDSGLSAARQQLETVEGGTRRRS